MNRSKSSSSKNRDVPSRRRSRHRGSHSEHKWTKKPENYYKTIFDYAGDAIFIHDMGGRFLEVNQVVCERLGYSREQLLQMTPKQIDSPEYAALVGKRTEELRKRGHAFYETAHVRRDGTIIPIELSSRVIEYKGKPAILSIGRDIIKRKQAEVAMRASEMEYRTLFENIPHGIYQTSVNGKLLAANRALVRLLGYDSETDLLAVDVGRDLYVNPDDRKQWMKELETRGEVRDAELVLKRKDGRELTVLDNAHVDRDEHGKILHYEGTLTDITERKRMEKELKRFSEQLEELVKERTKKLAESEKRFRELADLLPEIVFETDENGNLTFLNSVAISSTGYSPRDIQVGLNALQLFSSQDRGRRNENVKRIMSGETLGSNEYLLQRKDGSTFPAIVHSASIMHENKIVGLRGIAINIADRKAVEQKLQRSEQMFRGVAERSFDAIFTTDLEGEIAFASPAVNQILGYAPDEIVGTRMQSFLPESDIPRLRQIFDGVRKGRSFAGVEVVTRRKDGSMVVLEINISPVLKNGDVAGMQGVARDITERKSMEAELVKSERFAAIGETVMMVGHDLRNPLQVMVNSVALWEEIVNSMPSEWRDLADKRGVNRLLERVERQLEYMNKIVSDLQDYARPVKPELVSVDLMQLIKETLSSIAVPGNVKVSVKSAGDVAEIAVDPTLMKRVFANLITNAIQAMPTGGVLAITSSVSEGSVSINFGDTGVGIPEENLAKLFQPLFTTKSKGQGLGLAVCQRLVRAHGGNITVRSKVDVGTTFTVDLPLK